MGGAFVGVADDGTAIYWNPAGLAAGSYFSLALDYGVGEPTQQGSRGGDSKNTIIGVSMPALGLGYYRLEARSVVPSVSCFLLMRCPRAETSPQWNRCG